MSRSGLRGRSSSRASTLEAYPENAETTEGEISSERPPWRRRYRLAIHIAALVALVFAIAPLTLSAGVGWIDDEGAYALQVEALLDGGWDYGYWAADFDPEGRWQPISRAAVDGEHTYPYVKHPVYAVLLAGGAWLFGTGFGLYAVPMLGLVLAAVVSWLLAEEFEPRAGPVAFWLVAGSPLLIDAYVLYAHTVGAAVAGAALLAAIRVLRHGAARRRLAGFGSMLFLGALLRSEAILFGLALTAALVGALVWRARMERLEWKRAVRRRRKHGGRRTPDPPDHGTVRAAKLVAGVGVLALGAAALFERQLVAAIVGTSRVAANLGARSSPGGRTVGEFLEAKVEAAWRITFSGSETAASASRPIVVALVAVAAIALLWRAIARRQHAWVLVVVVTAAIGTLFTMRALSYPSHEIPGLFAAWPVALVGLGVLTRKTDRWSEARLILAATMMFGFAVYATQYDVGGAVEWGGRFLSLAIPGLAAVIAPALRRQWAALDGGAGPRLAGVVFVAVALMAPAVTGLWMLHSSRMMNRPFTEDVASVATKFVVIDSAADAHHLFPKLGWKLNERHAFLRTVPGQGPDVLEVLYRHGFDEVTLIHAQVDPAHEGSPLPRVEDVTPPHTASIGGAIHVLSREEGGEQ